MIMKQFILSTLVLIASYGSFAQDNPRCTGITKKGEQCKITKVDNTGKCRLHSVNSIRCGLPKKDGSPCKNIVKAGQAGCHLHKSN